MKKKWFQDKQLNVSALRICVVPGFWTGAAIAGAGAVAMFFEKSAAAAALTTGAGIMGFCLGAKAWQAKSENGGE